MPVIVAGKPEGIALFAHILRAEGAGIIRAGFEEL
jgi:hypothetical protein